MESCIAPLEAIAAFVCYFSTYPKQFYDIFSCLCLCYIIKSQAYRNKIMNMNIYVHIIRYICIRLQAIIPNEGFDMKHNIVFKGNALKLWKLSYATYKSNDHITICYIGYMYTISIL